MDWGLRFTLAAIFPRLSTVTSLRFFTSHTVASTLPKRSAVTSSISMQVLSTPMHTMAAQSSLPPPCTRDLSAHNRRGGGGPASETYRVTLERGDDVSQPRARDVSLRLCNHSPDRLPTPPPLVFPRRDRCEQMRDARADKQPHRVIASQR